MEKVRKLETEYGALCDEAMRLERTMNRLYNFEILNAEEQKAVDEIESRLLELEKKIDEVETELWWAYHYAIDIE